MFDEVKDWVAFAPETKLIDEPEVALPMLVLPLVVLMLTGAPLILTAPPEVIVAVERPVALIDPEVGAKVNAPVVMANPLEAVSVCVEVNEPVLVVVIPDLPRTKLLVLVVVPILTLPLVVPVPASTYTDPPVDEPAEVFAPSK